MNSWLTFFFIILVLQTVISENVRNNGNGTLNEFPSASGESRALSRRKRFLIFPEGSSLQLVFCNQVSALIPIGDIFLFGYTAALAWNLPTDPKYIYMYKEFERPLRRSDQVMNAISYLDENGRIVATVPYKKRIIVNPAFAKRSADANQLSFKEKLKEKIDRNAMHERHMDRSYLRAGHADKDTLEFHRSNRLGRDGRQCVLYQLCETSRRRREQGTFLEEFLSVVFTLPKREEFLEDEEKEYATAHINTNDCLKHYPNCVDSHDT